MKAKRFLILIFLFCFPVVCFSHYDGTEHNEQFIQDDNKKQVAWVNPEQFANDLEQAVARSFGLRPKKKKDVNDHLREFAFGGCASMNVNRR